ncbi:MAG: SpoIID/LytB domain-containing protein [Myxococcota bacterium]
MDRAVCFAAALWGALAFAAPLRVRVLEKERLDVARLKVSAKVACDGVAMTGGGELALRAMGTEVEVNEAFRCQELWTTEATVRTERLTRVFRGRLRVAAAGGGLTFLNEVEVEEYLRGVVGAELAGPPAALAAQAVVSRTFALASRGRHELYGYDVCDLAHCQLYLGREKERPDVDQAVKTTAGEVLYVGGVVLRAAYFHSSCGGHTSAAADVFAEEGAVGGVNDTTARGPWCAAAPDFRWQWRMDRPSLARALGLKSQGAAFEVLRRDRAGRAVEVRSFGTRFSGVDFLARIGRAFGYHTLKGMKVSAEEVEGVVQFQGHGLGHGVGLCQHGALAMAHQGLDYRRILAHYFPERTVAKPKP